MMKMTKTFLSMTLLDRNLFEIPASEISDATITATIFGGRTIYEKEDK
jgi:predicted amidohydrolase YtcJ